MLLSFSYRSSSELNIDDCSHEAQSELDLISLEKERLLNTTFPYNLLSLIPGYNRGGKDRNSRICIDLPSDVLLEIFSYFIDDMTREHQEVIGDSPLWRASRVCKWWREVILSSPQLWRNVYVDWEMFQSVMKENWFQKRRRRKQFFIELQLERSASHPISISIRSMHQIPADDPILILLLETCSRWEELHLDIPLLTLEAFSTVRGMVPLLTTLDMMSFFDADHYPLPPLPDVLLDAPRLNRLSGHPRILSHVPLPFSQITQFTPIPHGELYPLSWYLSLFKCTTNLSRCIISLFPVAEPSLDSVELPALESLEIDGTGAFDGLGGFLRHCTAPSLKELSVHSVHTVHIASLEYFLFNSSPPLESLSIVFYMPNTSSIFRSFSLLTKLKHLTIRACHPHNGTDILEALAVASATSTFLPSLQTLTLPQSIRGEHDARLLGRVLDTRATLVVDNIKWV